MNSLVTDLNNRLPSGCQIYIPATLQLTILYSKPTGNSPLPPDGGKSRKMYQMDRCMIGRRKAMCDNILVDMQQMCWLQELCAVLSTKLAQSRETLVAAAPVSASSFCCQLSLSDVCCCLSLFLLQRVLCRGIRDRWLFRLARPAPPRGFGSVVVAGSEDQHCASSH